MEDILHLIHIAEFLVHNLVCTCRGKYGKWPTEFSLHNDIRWVYYYKSSDVVYMLSLHLTYVDQHYSNLSNWLTIFYSQLMNTSINFRLMKKRRTLLQVNKLINMTSAHFLLYVQEKNVKLRLINNYDLC